MTDLALFDFDGTITTTDTFTAFLHFALPRHRLTTGKILLAPLVLGYKAGWIEGGMIRTAVSRYGFSGASEVNVRESGSRFAIDFLPNVIRPTMLERLDWHRQRGDQIVVVSASLDVYLDPWCRRHCLELVCTQLEFRRGRATGRYIKGDCSGKRKIDRIREAYDLSTYGEIYAYGDTREDIPMLAVADHKFYRGREVQSTDLVDALDHQPHQA